LRGDKNGEFKFASARGRLVGWIRKDLPEGILAGFMDDPESFFNDPSAHVLKDAVKTQVIQKRLKDGKGMTREAIIKRFHYGLLPRRLGFLFLRSPAARSLGGALLLREHGFSTPGPMAALEFRDWRHLGTSYYITEPVASSHSLRSFWQMVVPTLEKNRRRAVVSSVLRDLARLLSGLHSAAIYHADLKGSNILIHEDEMGRRQYFLIDLDRVEKMAPLSPSRRVKNLLQVKRAKWSLKETIYFFTRYAEQSCASKKEARTLVRKALALSRRRRSV
jgi:serine/threonine protein kinase